MSDKKKHIKRLGKKPADTLPAMRQVLTLLAGASEQITDKNPPEVKAAILDAVIDLGRVVNEYAKLEDMLGDVNITAENERPFSEAEARKAIDPLRDALQQEILGLMGDRIIALLTGMKSRIGSVCDTSKGHTAKAREHYKPVFEFMDEFEQRAGKATHSPAVKTVLPPEQDKPLEEWSAAEIDLAETFMAALRDGLQEARRAATSAEEREEIHDLSEHLRLADEHLEKASMVNKQNGELLAALRKIADASEHTSALIASKGDIKSKH